MSLTGAGLTDGSFAANLPLPDSLGGVAVTIGGRPARMMSVQTAAITLLVPTDLPATAAGAPVSLQLIDTSTSSFDVPGATGWISLAAPEFLTGVPSGRRAGSYMIAVHQDWSALVSDDSPAQPGEVLHTYAVGLGATTPAVPFGEAAPAQEPFARLSGFLACSTNSFYSTEVLFAGLAPNLVGIYQVDLRAVSFANIDVNILACSVNGSQLMTGQVPVGPPLPDPR